MLKDNKERKEFIVIFTCILSLAALLPYGGALAHMLPLSASFPICKIIPVLDPQLTGVFGSLGRRCLCYICRFPDKRPCTNKSNNSHL